MTERRRPPTNAYDDGKRTLYKFMRYPPDGEAPAFHEQRRKWVEELILEGKVYLPSAAEFNDPFEASPHFRVPEGTTAEKLAAYEKDLRERHAETFGWNEQQIADWKVKFEADLSSGRFEEQLQLIEQKWRPFLRSECPMLCLAGNHRSTLMWSYYAEGHSGVCIELDARVAPIGNAQRVEYDEHYPTICGPLGQLNAEVLVSKLLCWKSKVWEHEEEYRLVNIPRDARPGGPGVLDCAFRRLDKHRVQIPVNHITAVTVGANMHDYEIEKMLRICHDRRPRLPVYQARMQRGSFNLDFQRISS